MQRRLLFAQVVILVAIAVLDIYFGLDKQYFWTVSWWDVLLHILGGIWAGLFGAWLGTILGIRVTLIRCMVFAFAIGTVWEVFEYVAGMGGSVFMSYQLDTAKDLLDDTIGGALAYYLTTKIKI